MVNLYQGWTAAGFQLPASGQRLHAFGFTSRNTVEIPITIGAANRSRAKNPKDFGTAKG